MNKCPKCNAIISYVNIGDIPIHVNSHPKWKGISYLCPFCSAILGLQIDPVAIKTEIVNDVRDLLKLKTHPGV